jgi:ABC-type branched-subunit amino acid transport system permease subunit
VTGAVGGSFAVALLMEVARRLEGALHGASLGGLQIGGIFGLQEVTLGVLILLVMYRRRDGLFGRAELDEVVLRWRRRREAGGGGGTAPPGDPGIAAGEAT